jgi:hypothetical protein
MAPARESLYGSLDRPGGPRRWIARAAALAAVLAGVWLLVSGSPLLWAYARVLLPVLLVAVLAVVARVGLRVETRPERWWRTERRLAAIEVGEAEGRDVSLIPDEAARIVGGDVPALDAALETFQVATGSRVYPRFERLPRASYGERVDACVRLEAGVPVLCFTPALLETLPAPELFAVVAHLLARADLIRRAGGRTYDGVREADSGALLVTRDHVALLRALERCRTGAVPLATPGDREAWFSEDEAVPETYDDSGRVERWRRVDRLQHLRAHLGALALDVPEPAAEIRLARLFDTETGQLTEAAKDGLRSM